jgi:hypothetical protein
MKTNLIFLPLVYIIFFQLENVNAKEGHLSKTEKINNTEIQFIPTGKMADSSEVSTGYYMEPALIPAWWHTGDTVIFSLAGGNIFPELVNLTGVVTDVSGNEVTRVQANRAGLKSGKWSWKPLEPGYYEVKFSFTEMNGTEKILSRPVTIRTKDNVSRIFTHDRQGFAVLPPSNPVGKVVGQFGFTYSNKPVELKLAKLIGYDLVRLLCDWGADFTNLKGGIESTKGQYNWQIFDKKVDLFANAGFIINAQFNYTPLWASPYPERTNIKICVVEGTTYAPKEMDDFSRFVEAATRRYKDRIGLWEIWNEPAAPNGSIFWSDTPENFVRLLEAGYKAVKKVQPESQVWIGGMGARDPYHVFYDRILHLGAADYFDVLSLHGEWNTPAEKFRRIEENNHVLPKPAVSGEWHAILQGNMQSQPILSEAALSFKMMKDLLYQIKQGISRTMLFEMINLSEKETIPFAIENKMFTHSSGLFRRQPQIEPRQAAVVMANFLNVTGRSATYMKDFKLADGVVSLELATGNGPLVVFWSDSVSLKVKSLKPITTDISVLQDWEGKTIPLVPKTVLNLHKIYYLSHVNTEVIARSKAVNNLVSPRSLTPYPQDVSLYLRKITKGFYYNGQLFGTAHSAAIVPDSIWLKTNWKLTRLSSFGNDEKFSARAAVGVHEKGLDIVVEVQDKFQTPNVQPSELMKGDNIQVAIDCEGNGLSGGNTEICAGLTAQGPVVWKALAADLHGDLPSQWSSVNGIAKYVDQKITREGNLTSYHLRIPWSELYPLVFHEKTKPLRLSLVVNKSDASGRVVYLEWGGGIADEKDPSKYGALYLGSQRINKK